MLGLAIAIILESLATKIGSCWSYSDAMPVLPILQVGRMPLLQFYRPCSSGSCLGSSPQGTGCVMARVSIDAGMQAGELQERGTTIRGVDCHRRSTVAGHATYRTPIGLGRLGQHARGTSYHEGQVLRCGIDASLLVSQDG